MYTSSFLSYPTSHLPTWLRTALQNSSSIRVEFSDSHFIEIYPEQQRYIGDFSDLDLPSLYSAVPVRVTALPKIELGSREGRSLKQLHWAITFAYVQSEQRHRHFKFQIARLVSWPPLTDVPSNVLPIMARVCALLARRPTTTSLVPMILDVPQDLVFAVIEANCLYGHIEMDGGDQVTVVDRGIGSNPSAVPVVDVLFSALPDQAVSNSLIRKIWHRLLSPVAKIKNQA